MRRLLLFLLLAVAGSSATAQQTPPGSNHVVIISLDGFPGWAFEDPLLPVPTLRRLAASGAMSTSMRGVNPTVTWPTHTSMVTGVGPARHGVMFNGLLIREPGVPPRIEPWVDRDRMVHAKTLYDAAHERGLTTAQVDWVAIQNAPTITWEFAERPDPNSQIPREMVQAGLVSQADVEGFGSRNILWRDHIWTTAAAHIVRQHRPNLGLFHLLNLDSTHHRYGPRTPAGMTAMAHLDSQVAELVDAVEDAGLRARTTFFVVSDHGFKTVKRQVRPNAAFSNAGLLQVEGNRVTRAQVYSVPEGGSAIVYVTVPDADGAVLERARRALAGIEGIASVVEPSDYGQYGLAQPTADGQMGALFLTAAEGYAFTAAVGEEVVVDTPPTSLGAHGYVANDPEIRALFIASGRGVRTGVILPEMSTLDLAPTAARLLDVTLEDVDGRVLEEILDIRQ
jgi:predicted AlkP superfamily pyrophosphatase or phosphodiesterase